MHASSRLTALLLAALLPVSAIAGPARAEPDSLSASLQEARAEVRRELANARNELRAGNLELGRNLHFVGKRAATDADLPHAEISPAGDLLVDGKAVAVTPAQRRQLQDYRGQVIEVALAGLTIGEQAAEAALESVDRGLFSLMASAMTGRLERQLEQRLLTTLEPGILELCGALPALMESQQALAAGLPEFRPYANLRADDVQACEADVRREFARL